MVGRVGLASSVRVSVLFLLLAVWFWFTPKEPGFPLDDAWIFSAFAKNLRERGEWAFNAGEPSTGVTSLLWTLLLSRIPRFAESPILDSVLGARCLTLALGFLPVALALPWIYSKGFIGSPRALRDVPWLLSLLTVCQGAFLFHAYSGMETVTFAALGVLAIRCAFHSTPYLSGLVLACLILVRLEGVLLAMLLVAWGLRRRESGRVFASVLLSGGATTLILLHNWRLSGSPFPATFAGRRFLFKLDPDNLHLERLGDAFHKFTLQWMERIHDWCWMDRFLPGGEMEFPGGFHFNPLALTLNGLMIFGGALLLVRALEPRRWVRSAPLFLLLAWTLLHNFFYLVVLPTGGHAGRYQAINFLWPPLLVCVGLQEAARQVAKLVQSPPRLFHRGRLGTATLFVALGLLTIPTGISLQIWKSVLDSGIVRINRLHFGMGEWARANLPPETRVVAFDLGGFKIASGLYVIDQSGLLDDCGLNSFRKHNSPEFYRERRATHLFKFERLEEGNLSIDPVWKTFFRLEHRISLEEDQGLDREACQNAWSRCSLYRVEYRE